MKDRRVNLYCDRSVDLSCVLHARKGSAEQRGKRTYEKVTIIGVGSVDHVGSFVGGRGRRREGRSILSGANRGRSREGGRQIAALREQTDGGEGEGGRRESV